MNAERWRLAIALLVSLLIHALVLSLTFGDEALGLPGLALPWTERRGEAPDLQVVLAPNRVDEASTANPVPSAPPSEQAPQPGAAARPLPQPPAVTATPSLEPPATAALQEPPADSPGSPTASPVPPATSPVPPAAAPEPGAMPTETDSAPQAAAMPQAPPTADAQAPSSSIEGPERESEASVAIDQPLIALDRSDATSAAVPPQAQRALPPGPSASRPEAMMSLALDFADATRTRPALSASARVAELDSLELSLRAVRREDEQLRAARRETVRPDDVRQGAERIAAAQLEARRVEAERQEAARQEAARQEAARQEAARQEAARQEAARASAKEDADAARREASRRAMGRQLDEEAARRDAAASAARQASRLDPSASSRRRGRLFGRADANAELIRYAEAWARRIEMNMTFDIVREAAKKPHVDPLVTVAIRSDGFVESVTFVVSSGVPELDDAIRRVLRSQDPFEAFSPALASEFDVIEIRRSWHFDMAIRLQ